ncbi:MAG: SH3 domain-containing protein [Chloroflexi bacterium]|nr:SH3 domain-containing protein [Chloroflexota bacterium]
MNLHPQRVRHVVFSLTTLIVFAIVAIIVNSSLSTTYAQDGQRLGYGENLIGQVSGPEGSLFFFEGKAGDVAQIEVLGVGFAPSIALLDGTRTVVLLVNDNLALEQTATLEYTLISDGTYFIQVRAANNLTGQFAITLLKGVRQLPPAIPLTAGPAVQGLVASAELPAVYDFSTNATDVTQLRIQSFSPGYSPVITVLSPTNETIVSLNNPRLLGTTLTFAPGQENLRLIVDLGGFAPPATIEVQLTYGTSAVTGGSSTSPAGTEEPSNASLPSLPTSGQCVLATRENQAVNVRSGPSTDYPILVTISPQSIYDVVGRNADSSWYQITYGGGNNRGWVSAQVTRLGGNCTAVPIATFQPLPTATRTPTSTLPSGVTATPSPTGQSQIAPPDSDYFLNVNMGNQNGAITQGSISNVVSHPTGDYEDYVFFSTNNINTQGGSGTLVRQIFNFTCTGTGTEVIGFYINGDFRECGDSYTINSVGPDNDNGTIQISANGGSNTYVQWTIFMQVERLN